MMKQIMFILDVNEPVSSQCVVVCRHLESIKRHFGFCCCFFFTFKEGVYVNCILFDSEYFVYSETDS